MPAGESLPEAAATGVRVRRSRCSSAGFVHQRPCGNSRPRIGCRLLHHWFAHGARPSLSPRSQAVRLTMARKSRLRPRLGRVRLAEGDTHVVQVGSASDVAQGESSVSCSAPHADLFPQPRRHGHGTGRRRPKRNSFLIHAVSTNQATAPPPQAVLQPKRRSPIAGAAACAGWWARAHGTPRRRSDACRAAGSARPPATGL